MVTTVPTADLDSTITTTDSLCGGVVGGGLGVIIVSNLNRVRLSCCWLVLGWVVTIVDAIISP